MRARLAKRRSFATKSPSRVAKLKSFAATPAWNQRDSEPISCSVGANLRVLHQKIDFVCRAQNSIRIARRLPSLPALLFFGQQLGRFGIGEIFDLGQERRQALVVVASRVIAGRIDAVGRGRW